MSARKIRESGLEQQLADLTRRVEEMEAFLQRTDEIVQQGLLGDLVLEATVMSPIPAHLQPEGLAEMIRTVLREELEQLPSALKRIATS
ncbi:MAG TPA: hypothetical protein VH394_06710 [Thermoanaerobaculia bacterium]|jgi:hypothetical protein|nr:hypothetical protein [Thermoanaerobaculia bacterium]